MTERNTHQLRSRPPDVEEALSSMLWTPYERTPVNSSSEEDDDERLNKQLRRSHSTFNYYHTLPTNFVQLPMTSTYFGSDDDALMPSPAMTAIQDAAAGNSCATSAELLANTIALQSANLVPFSNFIYSDSSNSSISISNNGNSSHINSLKRDYRTTPTHQKNIAGTASNYRYSYPYYGANPNLHKWWSSSMATTTTTNTEPPSYESLYTECKSIETKPSLNNLKLMPADGSTERMDIDEMSNGTSEMKELTVTDHLKLGLSVEPTVQVSRSQSSLVGESVSVLRSRSRAVPSPVPSFSFNLNRAHNIVVNKENNVNVSNYHGNNVETLTPNKCLAELERLYAEFRATEGIIENNQNVFKLNSISNKNNNNNNSNNINFEMRLNIPASVAVVTNCDTLTTNDDTTGDDGVTKYPTSSTTSSVLLTPTNSVTTISTTCNGNAKVNNNVINNNNTIINGDALLTNSGSTNLCQRQSSLTIQVNNVNNNSNVNPSAIISRKDIGNTVSQSIVNNNGVSVVNCNYIQAINSKDTINSVSVNSCSSVPSYVRSIGSYSNSDNTQDCSPKVANKNSNRNIDNLNNNNNKNNSEESVSVIRVNPQTNPSVSQNAIESISTVDVITNSNSSSSAPLTPSRTFTSTECQTDDVELRTERVDGRRSTSANAPNSREQRRRERRERRQQQQQQIGNTGLLPSNTQRRHPDRHSLPAPPMPPHLHPPPHLHHALTASTVNMSAMLRPMLPDILHSHFPPPYSALPGSAANAQQSPIPSPTLMAAVAAQPSSGGTTLLTPVISTVPIPGGTPIVSDGRFTLPLPIIRRSPSERSGKGCCGQWFAGPPLRALIGVVALGGVACALGGAALGATGLAGPPSSHLTAALLMIGVGVVLVTVSGAAWRMTAPGGPPCLGLGSRVDLGRCGRRPCSRGGGAPHGLLYPEFQHRPPPPSYQASMQEYRLRLLLLDRDRQNGVVRGNSPPPTYRSHNGSLLRAPLTTTLRSGIGCASNGAGSEYSLPPSYRSRNATSNTMYSERSIEATPSGSLLANEDLPDSLSTTEQLHDLVALRREQRTNSNGSSKKHDQSVPVLTSAIVEIESFDNGNNNNNNNNNNSSETGKNITSKINTNHKDKVSTGCNTKDLVTIVTISQNESLTNGLETSPPHHAGDQIEILAHL